MLRSCFNTSVVVELARHVQRLRVGFSSLHFIGFSVAVSWKVFWLIRADFFMVKFLLRCIVTFRRVTERSSWYILNIHWTTTLQYRILATRRWKFSFMLIFLGFDRQHHRLVVHSFGCLLIFLVVFILSHEKAASLWTQTTCHIRLSNHLMLWRLLRVLQIIVLPQVAVYIIAIHCVTDCFAWRIRFCVRFVTVADH